MTRVTVFYEADGTHRQVYEFREGLHVSTQIFCSGVGMVLVTDDVTSRRVRTIHFSKAYYIESEVVDDGGEGLREAGI